MREGMTKPEVIRCLKRYVARQVYAILRDMGCGTWPPHRIDMYRSITLSPEKSEVNPVFGPEIGL